MDLDASLETRAASPLLSGSAQPSLHPLCTLLVPFSPRIIRRVSRIRASEIETRSRKAGNAAAAAESN